MSLGKIKNFSRKISHKLHNFYSILKLWYSTHFISDDKVIEELIKRRDEVVNRAISVANRTMPESLESIQDTMEWVVEPHLYRNWNPYKLITAETERSALRTTYKIMEVKEKVEQEKEN